MKQRARFFFAPILMIAVLLGAPSPAFAFLDKTRVAAHLGIAYYCFHHWVVNPYREGKFNGEAPHRTATMVKAGAALLFAVTQVRSAQKIARNSNDRTLQKLSSLAGMGGLGTLAASFGSIGERLKSGHFSAQDIGSLVQETSTIRSESAADGVSIKDIPVAIPGT